MGGSDAIYIDPTRVIDYEAIYIEKCSSWAFPRGVRAEGGPPCQSTVMFSREVFPSSCGVAMGRCAVSGSVRPRRAPRHRIWRISMCVAAMVRPPQEP